MNVFGKSRICNTLIAACDSRGRQYRKKRKKGSNKQDLNVIAALR